MKSTRTLADEQLNPTRQLKLLFSLSAETFIFYSHRQLEIWYHLVHKKKSYQTFSGSHPLWCCCCCRSCHRHFDLDKVTWIVGLWLWHIQLATGWCWFRDIFWHIRSCVLTPHADIAMMCRCCVVCVWGTENSSSNCQINSSLFANVSFYVLNFKWVSDRHHRLLRCRWCCWNSSKTAR